MPIFIEGILLLVMIFSFCVGFSIVIKLGLSFFEDKTKPSEKTETAPPPKVYYVKETTAPKRKAKKRKSPNVAFKGVILSPEQVKVIEEKKRVNQKLQV